MSLFTFFCILYLQLTFRLTLVLNSNRKSTLTVKELTHLISIQTDFLRCIYKLS